jgi:adenylate kinase
VCSSCGAIYSTSQPPSSGWTCDTCGGEVVQRDDDTEEAVRQRLALYEEQTAPLIAWFEAQGRLLTVRGDGDPDSVTARLIEAVDAAI